MRRAKTMRRTTRRKTRDPERFAIRLPGNRTIIVQFRPPIPGSRMELPLVDHKDTDGLMTQMRKITEVERKRLPRHGR